MVHHKEVNLKRISTCALDLIMMSADELDNFDTTAVTGLSWRHVVLRISPVPRVVTSWIVPRVALKAVNGVTRHAVAPSRKTPLDDRVEDCTCKHQPSHLAQEDLFNQFVLFFAFSLFLFYYF